MQFAQINACHYQPFGVNYYFVKGYIRQVVYNLHHPNAVWQPSHKIGHYMGHLIIHCSNFLSLIASFSLLKQTQVTLYELPFNTQLNLAAVVPCFPAAEDADPAACHQTSAICRSDPPWVCQIEENSSQISSQFKLYYKKVANNTNVIKTLFLFTCDLGLQYVDNDTAKLLG